MLRSANTTRSVYPMPARTSRPEAGARTPPRTAPGRPEPVLRFRIRITVGDMIAVGPGKIALLEAIDQAGSITGAAKRLDMSYRRAWILLDEMNRSLRHPVVDHRRGAAVDRAVPAHRADRRRGLPRRHPQAHGHAGPLNAGYWKQEP